MVWVPCGYTPLVAAVDPRDGDEAAAEKAIVVSFMVMLKGAFADTSSVAKLHLAQYVENIHHLFGSSATWQAVSKAYKAWAPSWSETA